jgi:hypothetical protein
VSRAVQQVELVPVDEQRQEPQALAVQPSGADMLTMIAGLAKDLDVEKLERLIGMQERILKHNAEQAFNQAFVRMQPEIPTIRERARTDKTSYAPLEDIVAVVRPILGRHGFTLSHRTEWPEKGGVKVIGILTHEQGHARQSEFVGQSDQSGSKNAIQALGSTVSYGKRYTTKDLLLIVTSEEDDDGQDSEKPKAGDAPAGYEDWQINMEAVADEGWPKLSQAFSKSSEEYRNRATRTDGRWWNKVKAKAEAAAKGSRR